MQGVIVIGDINVDITGKFSTWPQRESCSFSSKPIISLGGVGGNVAVALKRLGVNVHFFSAVGNDIFGSFYTQEIKKEGIDTSLIQTLDDYNTGLIFTIVEEDGEHVYLAFRLDSADIHFNMNMLEKMPKGPIFISGVTIGEGIESFDAVLNILKGVTQQKIFLDPSIRTQDGKIDSLRREKYYEALKFTDVFLPNEREILEITKKDSIDDAMDEVFKTKVEEIWIKRGSQDIIYKSKNGNVERFPALRVKKVIDTTGAGDAFDAAIIYGCLNNWTISEQASFAAQIAAYVIQRIGSTSSFPRISEVKPTE